MFLNYKIKILKDFHGITFIMRENLNKETLTLISVPLLAASI